MYVFNKALHVYKISAKNAMWRLVIGSKYNCAVVEKRLGSTDLMGSCVNRLSKFYWVGEQPLGHLKIRVHSKKQLFMVHRSAGILFTSDVLLLLVGWFHCPVLQDDKHLAV